MQLDTAQDIRVAISTLDDRLRDRWQPGNPTHARAADMLSRAGELLVARDHAGARDLVRRVSDMPCMDPRDTR